VQQGVRKDTERGGMVYGPGILMDAEGNPIGYGLPGESLYAPPVPGSQVEGPGVPGVPNAPQAPRAPKNTSAPRTPKAKQGRGGALSRILRGAASKLRGGKKNQ
jgi:hypothetical protein